MYNDIQKEHFSKEPNAQIVSEWIVRMNPGDFNPAHFHTDCHLSGLLYLKIPEGMERDSGGNLHFLHGSPTTFYTNQYQVAPKVGDTYLWPSWLQHFVYPYKLSCFFSNFFLYILRNFIVMIKKHRVLSSALRH